MKNLIKMMNIILGTCLCTNGWNGKHCTLEGCPANCNGIDDHDDDVDHDDDDHHDHVVDHDDNDDDGDDHYHSLELSKQFVIHQVPENIMFLAVIPG